MSIAQDGWRTLAEPTYAVTYEGEARELPAGLRVERVDGFPAWDGTEGWAFIDGDGSATYAYVTASALRFEREGRS